MRLLLAATIACSTAALTALVLVSSAVADTKAYDLSGFRKIEASKGFEIRFKQSPTWSVNVDSKYNNLDKIVVEKVGDTLRILRPDGFCMRVTRDGAAPKSGKDGACIAHNVEDIITISAPSLEALKLHAGVSFSADTLNVDTLAIYASAGIDIEIDDLRVDELKVDLQSGSRLKAAGTCAQVDMTLGAGTSVEASDLKCREADINAGVASSVEAYASERAHASAGISSSVLISGKPPKFTKSTSRFASTVSLAN